MQPDPEKASRDEAAEKEILKQVKASMTQEDLAELARSTKELKEKQETPDPPEALKAVPSLSLQDIPKKPIHVPVEVVLWVSIGTYLVNILFYFFKKVMKPRLVFYLNCSLMGVTCIGILVRSYYYNLLTRKVIQELIAQNV